MKSPLENFDRLLDNRVRLGIMALLVIHDEMEFTALKDSLALTDGNLATHIAVLERGKYLKIRKEFVGKKPQTTYMATAAGRHAFEGHMDALEQFIKTHR